MNRVKSLCFVFFIFFISFGIVFSPFISKASAKNEGGYTIEEFQALWLDKYGSIDELVQCYRFVFVVDNRPVKQYFCINCGLLFNSKGRYRADSIILCADCEKDRKLIVGRLSASKYLKGMLFNE